MLVTGACMRTYALVLGSPQTDGHVAPGIHRAGPAKFRREPFGPASH
jgi:hypothetical protein